MVSVLATGLVGLIAVGIYLKISTWRKNYGVALSTRFPVFYSPVHISDAWWLMLQPLLVPIFQRLPHSWTSPWLPMAQIWKIWKASHTPFKDAGSDTFVLATPNGNILWTCDASVINQLFAQHGKCQVPLELVKFYDIWGPTVGSVENDEWRAHRKVISAGFNTAINSVVWKEGQHQTQTLIDHWIEEGSVIPTVKEWTSRLALHVISSGFFNKRLGWKEYADGAKPVTPGHKLSFEDALFTVLKRLATVFMTPRKLLGILPGKFFEEANDGFTEWTKYMQELRQGTVAHIDEVSMKKNKSILEAIVVAGTPGIGDQPLPEESILGNIFFTLLAGHETTGNTMAFIMLLMAVHPDYQKRVQEDLDRQLGGRPKEEWTVEQDYATLQKGWVGAVQKEVLRLYCVAQFILRGTVAPCTVVDSKGQSHTIPANTLTLINFAAAFQNPAAWPKRTGISEKRRAELHNTPALDFDPSRWLDTDDTPDTKENQDYPLWFPFGQGPRSCIGRAFAQIEMTSVVATIFKDYSLELVVEEKMLRACNGDKTLAWEKTRDKAMIMLYDDIEANISIFLAKELPIRVVKRPH